MPKQFFAIDPTGELISGHETRDESAAACQDAARESGDDGEGYEVVEAGSVEIVEVSPEIGECTPGEYDAELVMLEGCYSACEDETRYTVSVRKARDGEAPGTYLTKANGNLQILGYSIEKPEDLIELQEAAFNRFCSLDRPAKCQSGQATGERCEAIIADESELTTIEWMPLHLRASHKAAGNSGTYPSNGAVRLRVCAGCAEELSKDED